MQIKDKRSKEDNFLFLLSPSLYPKEAIYATCYSFLDKFYVFLDKRCGKIEVSLKPKEKEESFKEIKKEFMNELLKNSLRYTISKRNQKIREYIVKTALFFSQPYEELDKFLLEENQINEKE